MASFKRLLFVCCVCVCTLLLINLCVKGIKFSSYMPLAPGQLTVKKMTIERNNVDDDGKTKDKKQTFDVNLDNKEERQVNDRLEKFKDQEQFNEKTGNSILAYMKGSLPLSKIDEPHVCVSTLYVFCSEQEVAERYAIPNGETTTRDAAGRGSRVDDTGRGNRVDDSGRGSRVDDSGRGSRVDDTGRGSRVDDTGRGSRVDDGFERIRRRLDAGQTISVTLPYVQPWLQGHLYEAPKCPVKKCVFTLGNATEDTDVYMVTGVLLQDKTLPTQRWPGQLYVVYATESAVHYRSDITQENSTWRHAFNLTVTHRSDADMHYPYGRLLYSPLSADQRPDYYELARKKKRTIVWMVSHCSTQSKRELYVREMQKYVNITIIGRCGGLDPNCPRKDTGPCIHDIFKDYLFYLSFENSICHEYMTEKVFKVYLQTTAIIPVVRGGSDYARVLPANTFIDADWFQTPKELALFLAALGRDLKTYSRMLELKSSYKTLPRFRLFCELCRSLVYQLVRPKVYDIKTWLDAACREPKNFTVSTEEDKLR